MVYQRQVLLSNLMNKLGEMGYQNSFNNVSMMSSDLLKECGVPPIFKNTQKKILNRFFNELQ